MLHYILSRNNLHTRALLTRSLVAVYLASRDNMSLPVTYHTLTRTHTYTQKIILIADVESTCIFILVTEYPMD